MFLRNWERNLPQTSPIIRNVCKDQEGNFHFQSYYGCVSVSLKLTSQCSGACPWHKQGGLRWPRQRVPTHSGQLCACKDCEVKAKLCWSLFHPAFALCLSCHLETQPTSSMGNPSLSCLQQWRESLNKVLSSEV